MILLVMGIPIGLVVVQLIRTGTAMHQRNITNSFVDKYRLLQIGMPKKDVIDILGTNYLKSATQTMEIYIWNTKKDFSSTKPNTTIRVTFFDDCISSYELQ